MKPEMASGRFQVLALPRGDRGLAMPLEDVLVPVPLKPQLPKTPKRMQTLGKPRAVVPFSKPKLSKEMKIKEVPNYQSSDEAEPSKSAFLSRPQSLMPQTR
jgi:hypothetical protein